MKWGRHPYIAAAIGFISVYVLWNSVQEHGGKLEHAIFAFTFGLFGVGRLLMLGLALWLLGCLITKPLTAKRPLKGIVYYIINASLLSGLLPDIQLGTTANMSSGTVLKYFGVSGLILATVFLDMIPFVGAIEQYIKKLLVPDIQKYIKSIRHVKPMKSAALPMSEPVPEAEPEAEPEIEPAAERTLVKIAEGVYRFRPQIIPGHHLDSEPDTLPDIPRTPFRTPSGHNIDSGQGLTGQPTAGEGSASDVQRLRQAGLTIRAITDKTGIPKSTIYDLLKKANES